MAQIHHGVWGPKPQSESPPVLTIRALNWRTLARKDVAETALFVAAVRARESRRKDPLFTDPLAETLAGTEGLARLAKAERNPASNYHRDSFPYLEVRTRYFDDWLLGAVKGSGARQVVLLGAGMDSRAFRLKWPKGLELWEVDTRELFALKESRLRSVKAQPTCERAIVETDLASPSWVGRLVRAGLEQDRPTVWLAEGLFQYLTEKAVNQVLGRARSVSGEGCAFAAEIISKEYITSVSNQRAMERRRERGTTWIFGTDDPEELFLGQGWEVDEAVGAVEAAVSMGRWSKGSSQPGPPGASFVSATRE